MHSPFASPYPQTPTPGGSSVNHLRPPLTSLKPFGYSAQTNPKSVHIPITQSQSQPQPQPLPISLPRKQHPLAQVSIMNQSISTAPSDHNNSHDLSLHSSEDGDDQASIDRDLATFKREQTQPPINQNRYSSNIVDDDGTEQEDETQTEEDEDEEQEQTTDHSESDSFRLGLSSLSPPGIGRFVPNHRRLSAAPLDALDDELSSVARDFSRDLSALSLSPIRRPSAPTPLRAMEEKKKKDQAEISTQPTPRSGFEGMAQEIRRDFEKLTGLPISDPQHPTQDHPGTLRGTLNSDGTGRARRVFGADLGNQPAKPQSRPLHSTPPAGLQARKSPAGGLFKLAVNPVRAQQQQPAIQVVEASTSAGQHKFMHEGSLSAPAKHLLGGQGNSVRVPDVTGLTDALRSPEKADFRSGSKMTDKLEPSKPDPTLNEALTLLRRRLATLESENQACQGRIQELQDQLTRERRTQHKRAEEPPAGVERMVQKLKVYTRKLNSSIEAHATALDELNAFKSRNRHVREDVGEVRNELGRWSDEVGELKRGLEGLAGEVREIRGMIEGVMEAREPKKPAEKHLPGMVRLSKTQIQAQAQAKKPHNRPVRSHSEQTLLNPDQRSDIEAWRSQASSPRTGRSFIGADEIERLKKDLAHEQSIRTSQARPQPPPPAAAVAQPQSRPTPVAGPSKAPPPPLTRVAAAPLKKPSALKTPPANVPQQIAQEMSRAEAIFKNVPARRHAHDNSTCSECRRRRQTQHQPVRVSSAPPATNPASKKEGDEQRSQPPGRPGPQTVLVKIIHEIEEDFETHRKIFVELSETYRAMEPGKEDLVKRKALAAHLKESVDTLEKKAEQIHELYRLLEFRDLPL
ncbi:hypothetical protein CROQUDRAFT_46451 [Cronartium quercuum f. sp. fusiforme G11]|uniref:Cep57 centrosome microtubule-binding domain-containing protein n=1 Tax=Cronartium quercuum f. sp. fusiforme G11 TaxID=708437 RepID=A0A9P6NG46_9BASI|nr:hypothetical protein CROQUDRAFT_46451 [Cronartium quercuum f. sp. fusiforme G11]